MLRTRVFREKIQVSRHRSHAKMHRVEGSVQMRLWVKIEPSSESDEYHVPFKHTSLVKLYEANHSSIRGRPMSGLYLNLILHDFFCRRLAVRRREGCATVKIIVANSRSCHAHQLHAFQKAGLCECRDLVMELFLRSAPRDLGRARPCKAVDLQSMRGCSGMREGTKNVAVEERAVMLQKL